MFRLLAAVLLLPSLALAAAGGTAVSLAHQGYVLGSDDLPLNAAAASMRFQLFASVAPQEGEQPEWEATCPVKVSRGYYSVILGEGDCAGTPVGTPADATLDTADFPPNAPRFLQVTYESITLAPRLQVSTWPSSRLALVAQSVPATQTAGCGSAGSAGLVWFDTASQALKICNGTQWMAVGSGAGAGGVGLAGLPQPPVQYVEFATTANPANPATWDQTGTYTDIVNAMTWVAGEKAYRGDGLSTTYIDSRWKPPAGGKTACMWKKFYDATNMNGNFGLEGYQQTNRYFYYGSYAGVWYYYSGNAGGNANTQTSLNNPIANEWVFYCMASTGNNGTTQIYTATIYDTEPKLRHLQTGNGNDTGHAVDTFGMLYGRLDTAIHPSKAYYGGFIHWNVRLTAAEVKQAYDATRGYYPGHGGTR